MRDGQIFLRQTRLYFTDRTR